jgi:undecaprenyl-diphosphatase
LFFDKKKSFQAVSAVAVAIMTVSWLSPVLKAFFHRPRPHIYWEHVNVIFSKPLDGAFPSGHTAVIFSLAFILDHYYPKKMRWTYVVAIWVAITRVYVGAHYPTDLVGGVLLGAACAWFAWSFVAYLERRNAKT